MGAGSRGRRGMDCAFAAIVVQCDDVDKDRPACADWVAILTENPETSDDVPQRPEPADQGARREPSPFQQPKPAEDDPDAPARVRRIMDSPSYRLAAADPDFLRGDDTRGLRLLLDYLKPELALQRHGVDPHHRRVRQHADLRAGRGATPRGRGRRAPRRRRRPASRARTGGTARYRREDSGAQSIITTRRAPSAALSPRPMPAPNRRRRW